MRKFLICVSILLTSSLFLSCSHRPTPLELLNREQAATIQALSDEVKRLNEELEGLVSSREDLVKAKEELENKLREELTRGDLSVTMESRGVVVTVMDSILFDSGKTELKDSVKTTLDKLTDTLNHQVAENRVYVEGHTDNVPIRYSGWRSNWELSTARATEVVHYFVDEKNINPVRVAATGYGEYQPVADNGSEEGRLKNRRVEIIISPYKIPN